MDIYFNVAFKPVATIMQSQTSVDKEGHEVELKGKGRHDPCVVPRAVPIVEAMAALVIADHLLRHRTTQL
jgi:chorismate synthase